jgi:GT2 family glycosyltransferase
VKLIVLDIESSLPPIAPPERGEQWLLLRLHGRPLGTIVLGAGQGFGAAELRQAVASRFHREIARHLTEDALIDGSPHVVEALTPARIAGARCRSLPDETLPTITVAVCTRDRSDRLAACLESLAALDYPPSRLERIVVDNAPADDASERLVRGSFPDMRYVCEPRPGLDWARNRAVLESRGAIVAFTDDDVIVDRGWARALASVFVAEPDAMAVTGLVVPDETSLAPQILFERYGGFGRGFERRYFRVDLEAGELASPRHGGAGRFGTGANMAFRRRVFDDVGLFDPALDVGTAANGGGDLEMFFRVLKAGHLLVYEPAALVRHRHRVEYGALKTQLANNGVGFYAYLVRTARAYPDERLPLIRLGLWWFRWWNLRRLAASLLRPSSFPRDLVLAELRGSLQGLSRYGRARRQAREIDARFGPQTSGAASGS